MLTTIEIEHSPQSTRVLKFLKCQWLRNSDKHVMRTRKFQHIACFTRSDNKILNTSNGTILFGMNQRKTHPLMQDFQRSKPFEDHSNKFTNLDMELHAEIDLITKTIQSYRTDDLSELTLWIARFDHCAQESLKSTPCIGCQSKMQQFGIKTCNHT